MKIPKDEHEIIFRNILEGATYSSQAKKYGVSGERIRQLCKRAGISSGIEIRRHKKIQELWGKLDRTSYELFYYSE